MVPVAAPVWQRAVLAVVIAISGQTDVANILKLRVPFKIGDKKNA